ncbi:MAG: C40 family peptidase [Treponema sp.]|nr:C40 family peptidase [Treponema sp.]
MVFKFFQKSFWLFCLLLIAAGSLAATPLNERHLQGLSAAEARLKLLATAESYLGTPYRFAGIDRRGMDCSGLVYRSFLEAFNYSAPRRADGLYIWAQRIDTSDLQPGDLVFFVTVGSAVSHVGIYTGGGQFIHSASEGPQTGVIYSSLDESYWRRTYIGAGRALPWEAEAEETIAAGRSGTGYGGGSPYRNGGVRAWTDAGFFTGFGAAWSWGAFAEGNSSALRGISALASAGYKWSSFRAGLELRPEWDRGLGVFRLPFTMSMGTDTFQFFAGPAYTFGEPSFSLDNGERHYTGGGDWLWGAGLSAAFPPIKMGPGALSFYGELALQQYHWGDAEFRFWPDINANFRASTGMRYLWKL